MRPENRYDSLFQYYGWKSSVDWILLKAQVKAESDFNPEAVSPAGALGLAQFMPATFSEWIVKLGIKKGNAFNPEHAVHCQAEYMAWLSAQLGSDRDKALAAYNWGIGNINMLFTRRLDFPSERAWSAEIPRETREYIYKVDKFYRQYQRESQNTLKAV